MDVLPGDGAPGDPLAPGTPDGLAVANRAPAGALPRWLTVLLGLAAATVAIAGLREIAWLVGPVLLAVVVVVALAPVQQALDRHGFPRWLSTVVLLLLVYGVLLGLVGLIVLAVTQFALLLPDYADEANALLAGVTDDLTRAGLDSGQISDLVSRLDYGQLVSFATGALSRLTSLASTLVLVLSALLFVTLESAGFSRRLALVAAERPHLPIALGLFARGTRSYLLVSSCFGALVAVGDYIVLSWLGVPLALLWGLLSFITNYVPNIGFVLGVAPPALLGLLHGGWSELLVIVIAYSLLNFVVQTLVQPRFVGDSVGLSMTVTFLALLFWSSVLGALGALLAIPLTLLVKALLVDVDPRGHWLDVLLREEPRAPRTKRARRRVLDRRAALESVRAHVHVPRLHGRPPDSDRGHDPSP
ncbi:AI-2E family transporter [Modestobacter sp. I12A-02628]|uniref:AI-2E family transporter n=1 Tax=Goekera deserti TaxID=2497753 RepID=A0A7K3WCR5_9ACTN|nr:AI-2E family transporter [Goekera deserti]MPQ96996.1 AI-2E family transporter [Goekera deserti]NDI46689.1 AI-2E family transporter [Goekera deserti]NEL54258.1 AI-2E family transporter [Goekera deserti]